MLNHIRVVLLLFVIVMSVWAVTAQDTPDFNIDDLVIVNIIETELLGGPVGTSGYLSPDGSMLMHTDGEQFCFYALPDLDQLSCTPHPEGRNPLPDSIVWSPDSRYLAFMDFDFLRSLRDSDIWIIDSADGTMTNLTEDDSFDAPVIRPPEGPPPHMDLEPRWMDDTTVAFIRYDYDVEAENILPAAIYSVSVEGGDPTLVRDIPDSNGRLDVYYMDWLAGQDQYIFNRANRGDDEYYVLLDNGDEAPQAILEETDVEGLAASVYMLSLSPNAEQALIYDGRPLSNPGIPLEPENSPVRVVDLSTSELSLIDREQIVWEAGWAPDGMGLVYTTRSIEMENDGLYLTSAAGEPGRMILEGRFAGTTSYSHQPIQWASNNTILVRNNDGYNLVLIELGTE